MFNRDNLDLSPEGDKALWDAAHALGLPRSVTTETAAHTLAA